MVTRERRIAEFQTGLPPTGERVELLCEDHCGTYALPFAVFWSGSAWVNAQTDADLTVAALGWRRWPG
jgi:hypothetical protein